VEKNKPVTVDEYIAGFSEDTQELLKQMRECLRKVAPEAEESLKWSQPAFSFDTILFQYAAFKHHISLYPTPSAIKAFAKDLKDYKTSSSTIQFPLDKPLPLSLIQQIAEYRVKECIENNVKWM